MRTTWLYTSTSMRWHWNLDQPGPTLSSLQVRLVYGTNALLCVKYPLPAFRRRLFSTPQRQCVPTLQDSHRKSSSKDTLMTRVSIFNAKCELSVKALLWTVISVHSLLPDQTPTPTRFLKNCEEVGLFNELAGSLEQDEDDKRAKNSVRKLWGWWFCLCFYLCTCLRICISVLLFIETSGILCRDSHIVTIYFSLPSFLPQVLM